MRQIKYFNKFCLILPHFASFCLILPHFASFFLILPQLGSSLGQAWVKLGSSLGQAWVKLGSNLGQAWVKLGQTWVKLGSNIYLVERNSSKTSPILWMHKMESEQEEEDTEMLIRLVKLRHRLWC